MTALHLVSEQCFDNRIPGHQMKAVEGAQEFQPPSEILDAKNGDVGSAHDTAIFEVELTGAMRRTPRVDHRDNRILGDAEGRQVVGGYPSEAEGLVQTRVAQGAIHGIGHIGMTPHCRPQKVGSRRSRLKPSVRNHAPGGRTSLVVSPA